MAIITPLQEAPLTVTSVTDQSHAAVDRRQACRPDSAIAFLPGQPSVTNEQILVIVGEGEAGLEIADLARTHGITQQPNEAPHDARSATHDWPPGWTRIGGNSGRQFVSIKVP
jgi:hypothetical protein